MRQQRGRIGRWKLPIKRKTNVKKKQNDKERAWMEIYAHRGASGTHPENTLAAFEAAARLPIDGVEFDVHLTKDEELVIIHDETIDRTSNGSGYIKDMTLEELRKFDFGVKFSEEFKGEMIPTLEEVLQVYVGTNHRLNIELKSDVFDYEGVEKKVITLLNQYDLVDRVIISSFNHKAIQRVQALQPEIETAALFMKLDLRSMNEYEQQLGTNILHVYAPAIESIDIDALHQQNGKIRVFTVNRVEDMDKLQALGIDAVFTDFPQELKNHQLLKSKFKNSQTKGERFEKAKY